jgi:hypothetical protein
MGQVAVFVMSVVVVGAFFTVQTITHGMSFGGEPHAVEDEELEFRAQERRIANAGLGKIGLGTLGGGAGVAIIGLAR